MKEESTSVSLLVRVKKRDQDAWSQLVFLYGPLVDHWCRRWGLRGPDADDLRQETFQAVASGLDNFRRDRPGDSFRGWLRVIAHRKFLDHCRRRQRQVTPASGGDVQDLLLQVPSPEAAPDDPPDEIKRLHHRALELVHAHFEARTWQAFWQCAVEGKSPLDVARDMGMSPASVRQAKSRVLRRLKEEMGELLG